MKQIEQATILTHNYEGHEIRSMLKDGHIYIAQSDLLAVFGHETLFSKEDSLVELLAMFEDHEKVAALADYLFEQGLISKATRNNASGIPSIVCKFLENKEESHND